MTKRKDKKGGALKGRAMAAKDAVKSKATAVPGAGSVLNAVAEAADVANALAKEAEQQIGNRPGGSTEGAPPAPSKPTEAQVGDNFIHLTWSMPSDAGDGPFIFEVRNHALSGFSVWDCSCVFTGCVFDREEWSPKCRSFG